MPIELCCRNMEQGISMENSDLEHQKWHCMTRSSLRRSAFACLGIIVAISAGASDAAPIVELNVAGASYTGLNVAHNQKFCWLATRDGAYERIDLSDVTSFRKAGGEFHSVTPAALAGELRVSLGRKFEVVTRGHYIVCAPSGQAGQYADLLSRVEKSFNGYFNRRGWPLESSQFPLVVIVQPNQREFARSCLAVGQRPSPMLRGFYHPQTNRVTLYDQAADAISQGKARSTGKKQFLLDDASRSVAIHEAIHQLAFNSGLHQRIGENPRWVVEGLATMLESGALDSTVRNDTAGRINPERLQQFQEYRIKRRQGTIADLISHEEELYQSAPLDFYGEAWALTFYLSEARRPDYVRYLKRVAQRSPLEPNYSAEDRLADVQAVFGKDLRWLETQFLRFIDKLE